MLQSRHIPPLPDEPSLRLMLDQRHQRDRSG
jgi:hypothetical protein